MGSKKSANSGQIPAPGNRTEGLISPLHPSLPNYFARLNLEFDRNVDAVGTVFFK
jgi:hypothetical protein